MKTTRTQNLLAAVLVGVLTFIVSGGGIEFMRP
jgi:hypothetical protein